MVLDIGDGNWAWVIGHASVWALVATPIKLIVFVLADGWLLIATMLLSSFAPAGL